VCEAGLSLLRSHKGIPLHLDLRLSHLSSKVFEVLLEGLFEEPLLKLKFLIVIDQVVKFE